MAAPRILLCGDALGRLNQLFKRVSSVNKSAGPFDALLCVGQFFPDAPEQLEEFNDYVEGRSKIPIPTYFIGDYGIAAPKILSAAAKDSANLGFKMDGFKVCENLYWLRGSGKFLLHGLSVAYLSGKRSTNSQQFGAYSQDDIDSLRALIEEPGITPYFLVVMQFIPCSFPLLDFTNEWPSGVTNRAATSGLPSGMSDPSIGDSHISELVAEIKPRYHIAGSTGIYYDREPYANIGAAHVTRFISLAPVGNKDKQKFIHALSPTPASKMSAAELCTKPPNTTLCPYSLEKETGSENGAIKRSGDSESDSQYWRYDVSQKRQKHGDGAGDRLCFKFSSSGSCPRGDKCHFRHDEDAREQSLRGVCFDFLNKGKCERGPDCTYKHSLQEEGKGLPSKRSGSGTGSSNRSKECWFCLSSSSLESHLITSIGEYCYCALAKGPLIQDHVLIIPIEHLPNTLSLPPECEKELSRLRGSLQACFKRQGKEVIFFEWVSKRGTHANLQAVPIPSSKASSVEQIFNLAAKKLGFTFSTLKNDNSLEGRKVLGTHLNRNQSLFYVEIPGGTILSHVVEENENFPFQFGREVLAGLLNMADKADWRNCQLSKDEETEMAENFKSQFKEYDPNS
ncbi:CwfJ-like family protein / zinc finger family protein [Perilla frutescens var. frutescens]|nr:CwfJ-like family protein / zinc finger family protein [Perilla frutescens var. frutescens]